LKINTEIFFPKRTKKIHGRRIQDEGKGEKIANVLAKLMSYIRKWKVTIATGNGNVDHAI